MVSFENCVYQQCTHRLCNNIYTRDTNKDLAHAHIRVGDVGTGRYNFLIHEVHVKLYTVYSTCVCTLDLYTDRVKRLWLSGM